MAVIYPSGLYVCLAVRSPRELPLAIWSELTVLVRLPIAALWSAGQPSLLHTLRLLTSALGSQLGSLDSTTH